MRSLSFAALVAATVACTADLPAPAVPNLSTNDPSVDRARPPAQAAAPKVEPPRGVVLTRLWARTVGRTDEHSTMALSGRTIVIGTHGGSYDAIDEAADAVYLIDATTGAVIRTISAPGHGNRDVNGVAVDAGRVFFSTGNGQVVGARLDGTILWARPLGSQALAAPTLVEVTGDGALDVVVGDERGRVHALDGHTGEEIWTRSLPLSPAARATIEAGIGSADLDGDGIRELVVGSWDGTLSAMKLDGEVLWSVRGDGRLRATPILADLDGDGHPEVLGDWETGEVKVLDGRTGEEMWRADVGRQQNVRVKLLGSPVPYDLSSRGLLAVPVGREPAGDGLYLLGEFGLVSRSGDGRVVGTPLVASVDPGGPQSVLFGTSAGEVVTIDRYARRTTVATVGGPIEASPMVADVAGDGTYATLVAANDGVLTCFAGGAKEAPLVGRFRGDSATNDGVMKPTNLRWSFHRTPGLAIASP